MPNTLSYITQQRSLEFVKWLSCAYETGGSPARASERFLARWPRPLQDTKEILTKSFALFEKAAVAPGDTVNPSWAAALTGPTPFAEAFLALVHTASIFGQIPNFRRVPFNVTVPEQTDGGQFFWVGQNSLKPITKFQFSAGTTLDLRKAEGIVTVTHELMRLATPGAEGELQNALVGGLAAFLDQQFLDPTVAGSSANPPSVTFGVAPIAGTGNLRTDVGTLLAALYAVRPGAKAVLIMAPGLAAQLIGPEGYATPYGVAALVQSAAAGTNVIAIDPASVLLADGAVNVDTSNQALIDMGDGTVVSLFQSNHVALRVEHDINYHAVAGAVQYLDTTTP